jgi:hypothetical protein
MVLQAYDQKQNSLNFFGVFFTKKWEFTGNLSFSNVNLLIFEFLGHLQYHIFL